MAEENAADYPSFRPVREAAIRLNYPFIEEMQSNPDRSWETIAPRLVSGNWVLAKLEPQSWGDQLLVQATIAEARHLTAGRAGFSQPIYDDKNAVVSAAIDQLDVDEITELLRKSWRLVVPEAALDAEAAGFADDHPAGPFPRHVFSGDRCERCGITKAELLKCYVPCRSPVDTNRKRNVESTSPASRSSRAPASTGSGSKKSWWKFWR